MTLATDEFIRRFLLHVLPDGFHRIRHYGLLASNQRAATIAQVRALLADPMPDSTREADDAPADQSDRRDEPRPPCPCCGGRMIIVERFSRGTAPRTIIAIRIDTS